MNAKQQAQLMRNRAMIAGANPGQIPQGQNINLGVSGAQYYDPNVQNPSQPQVAMSQMQPQTGGIQNVPSSISTSSQFHNTSVRITPQSQIPNSQQQQPQQNSVSSGNNQQNQSSTSSNPSSATAEMRATDVVSRLKVLSEKHLKESLHKVFSTCITAVNSQGGRDNGATDVTTAGSASGGDKDSSSNENSNIAFGQSVEECMSVLDQIEMNLQLSIDWSNQLKVMDKFCTPQQQQQSQSQTHEHLSNLTTEEILNRYEKHKEYSDKMKATIDLFVKQLSADDSSSCGTAKSLNAFPCVALL
ncbi:uncharacterized protein LOC134845203 isoform X2 [Symsagittifera roscoffensis]|uniref:uncharacterized protein LOC134845203 isoform X2 n=1 Tax=Symsagittifera roscoffensis TaxID=84072 RepID=UPI00307CB319